MQKKLAKNCMYLQKLQFTFHKRNLNDYESIHNITMCHSRIVCNKINKLNKRNLRLVYNDRQLTFEELLDKDKSLRFHHQILQVLAAELYKVYSNVTQSFTAWKVSVFGVILVRIFPHLDWILLLIPNIYLYNIISC